MKFDPETHKRRSIRLKDYDYSQPGAYFITICTYEKNPYFDLFPSLKKIVDEQWNHIPDRYANIVLDEYIIMPNHLHGIIIIKDKEIVGATLAVALDSKRAGSSPAPTIGAIIGAFKSISVKKWIECSESHKYDSPIKIWQWNYFDHIIRNESALNKIRQYIINNPQELELKSTFDLF